jgi:hypothetical protein
MGRLVFSIIAIAVALLAPASRLIAEERLMTGELVVVGGQRFHLVGHSGTFTAPAQVALAALEGKVVEVEVGADGRVTRVSERHIPIVPRISMLETIRGQLLIRDTADRTFVFAGDTRVYAGPAGVDMRPYNGKWVEAILDANGRVTRLTLLPGPPPVRG